MILMGVPNCGFCEIGYSVRIRGILWGPGENGLLKCWILSELCCNSTAALFSCVSPSCQSQCILSHLVVRRSRTRCRRLQRKFGPRRMGRVGLSWISQLWEKALGFFPHHFSHSDGLLGIIGVGTSFFRSPNLVMYLCSMWLWYLQMSHTPNEEAS